MGKKSSSTPKAPDYTQAAIQQGKDAKQIVNSQTWANRPNQTTPWGTVTWDATTVKDPTTGKNVTQWSQNVNLTPAEQAALEAQQQLQLGRTTAANGLLGQATSNFANPFDFGSLPEAGKVGPAPKLSYYEGASPTMRRDIETEAAQRIGEGPMLNTDMRALRTQNNVNLSDNGALQATDDAARQRIEEALFNRMSPMHERQTTSLEVKLANQGITPGSAAYKRAMQDLGDQQSREKYDALQTAGQEIQRNQQMALGNRQQFTNEDLATAGLFNTANQQKFNQNLQSAQFGNSALQQMYANALSGAGLNNSAISQDFNQRLASGEFYNQGGKDQQALDLSRLGFNNTSASQQQALDIANADYQNRLRQMMLGEGLMARNMPLNEMNALLSGQQVGMPQMPNFNAAGAAQPTQYLPAAGMQYQSALDASNAANMGQNSMMSGMGNLFGSALSAYASNPSAFSFSDSRLKKIIGKVGKIGEFNLYRFKYLGSNEIHEGVIAQEVQKVKPELVAQHPNGYLMVNYAGLEA